MTTVRQNLVATGRQSHRPHAIVMAVVMVAALISASSLLASGPSDVAPSTSRPDAVTPATRMIDAAVMPQSLGYLEFDWSSATGGVPGFAPLSDDSITRANESA